jgi:alpha-1,2-mannosyltransferase
VQAQAARDRTRVVSPVGQPPWNRILALAGLVVAALLLAASVAGYAADLAAHSGKVVDWYDLNVYNDAGLITRQLPSILYSWELKVGVQYTYTPFAAVIFAGGSLLPWVVLRWLVTIGGIAAVPVTVWLVLGAMGRRGIARAAVALAVSAVALWLEPEIKALFLGQIEPLLLLLVVWDLTLQDKRWWKGMGIGVAAGIKLIPGLFIPYLLLAGKYRQAAVAAGTFVGTVVIGFVVMPGPSASYWLTGYFLRPGRTGGVDSLVNQSLLGAIARIYGNTHEALPTWLPITVVVGLLGVIGGAMLTRAGKVVPGWVLVGITALLCSPISWDHHWVWIIPFLAMLAGYAMTAKPVARYGLIVALVATVGLMGSWPWRFSGPGAYVPRRGLLGWFVHPPQVTIITAEHGWKLLTWNLFVVIGLLIYLVLLGWAWPAWRNRPRPQVSGPDQPGPIKALLARTEAVLRGGASPKPDASPSTGSATAASALPQPRIAAADRGRSGPQPAAR